MEWDHHFCLICDRRTDLNNAYCSEACRAADSVPHMAFQSPPMSPSGPYGGHPSQPFNCPPLLAASLTKDGRAPPALSPPQSANSVGHGQGYSQTQNHTHAHHYAQNQHQQHQLDSHSHAHAHSHTGAHDRPSGPAAPASAPFPSGAGYPGSLSGTSAAYSRQVAAYHQSLNLSINQSLPPQGKYSHQYPHSLSAAAFDYDYPAASAVAATPVPAHGSHFPQAGSSQAPYGTYARPR